MFRIKQRQARSAGLWLAIAALTAAASPIGAAPAAASAQDSAVARQRLAILDQVWREIEARYYDPRFNGVDWNAVGHRYRQRLPGVADERQFYALLRSMVGELGDAHTRVLTPAQTRDRRRQQSTSAGVILFEVGGEPVVFDVRPGSPAAEAGLRPGMRVLAVNGVPINQALSAKLEEVGRSSSTRAAKVLAYLHLVAGAPEERLHLTLAGPSGAPRAVDLPRRVLESKPRFESRMLAGDLLYVKFDRFRGPVAAEFRRVLTTSPGARGLIVDLRSNTGGDGKEGMKLVGPLLDRPTGIVRLATRSGKPPSALGGLVKLPMEFVAGEPGGQLYSGPIVILTNAGTASTSEVIAASLQERRRARVVGSQSCGCALGVLKHRPLKDGGSLAISEVGLVSGLGRRIEGQGVTPDIPVETPLSEFERGADPALQAAILALTTRQ
jgi:carboxyl-terminal processing protease